MKIQRKKLVDTAFALFKFFFQLYFLIDITSTSVCFKIKFLYANELKKIEFHFLKIISSHFIRPRSHI